MLPEASHQVFCSIEYMGWKRCCSKNNNMAVKVSKGAKIRNRYNQVPHLTQDTNGKVTNSQ